MTCDCAERVNKSLATTGKGGSQLALTMPTDGSSGRPMLQVGRRGEPWKKPLRGNPEFIVPSYCPFCGRAYVKQKRDDAPPEPHPTGGEEGA